MVSLHADRPSLRKCGPPPALSCVICLYHILHPSRTPPCRHGPFPVDLLSADAYVQRIMASSRPSLWTYVQNNGETTTEAWLPCAGRVCNSESKARKTKRECLVARGCGRPSEARNGGCGNSEEKEEYVKWVRGAHPYIHVHRGSTFVVMISGEVVDSHGFHSLLKVL